MNPPPLPSGASPDGSSQRLRVAHVVHGFGIGGLERSVAQLVEHLDRERYEHSVFCFGEVGPGRWWIRPGRAELVPLAKRKGNDPLLVRRLAKRLRASAVDVVHSHNWGTRVEAAVASRWVGAAHVHSLHGAPTEGVDCTPWRSRMRAQATRATLERAQAVVAVSPAVRDQFIDWCSVSETRIEVIPNAVDRQDPTKIAELRRATRAELGLSNEALSNEALSNEALSNKTLVIGSVGRLERVKGFDVALEAVAKLARDGQEVHFLLAGHGSQESALRKQADQLGLRGRLILLTRESDATRWLAAMDLFVNSSLSEGLSLAVLEAMAVGLPLVVTDVGEHAALVAPSGNAGGCGLVAPPGDAAALAGRLAELRDPEHRRQLGERARQLHQRSYRTELRVDRFDQLYRRLGEARGAHR